MRFEHLNTLKLLYFSVFLIGSAGAVIAVLVHS